MTGNDQQPIGKTTAPSSRSSGATSQRLPQFLFLIVAGGILLSCAGCCVLLLISNENQPNIANFYLGMLVFCLAIFTLPALTLLYLLFFTPESIRSEQVIDRWSSLVDGGNGHRQQVVDDMHQQLAALDPPQTMIEERLLSSGRLLSASGDRRPFVVASHSGNFRLEPYRMYISVRDYGNALQTSWYLVTKPTLWQSLLQRLGLLRLDFFEEEDLRAYVTAVHHCFIAAVVALLMTLGQDADNLDRSSKGFLGVS